MASPSTASSSIDRQEWLFFAAAGLLSSAWCLASARYLGATFDEPLYLEAGLDYWRNGTFRQLLSAGVMPLSTHLQTLPLYVMEAAGRSWALTTDIGEMLAIARSVTLLFWWTLLFYAWQLARVAGGRAAGMLALALLAADPNLLAHATLATTDIALAAMLLAFTFHYALGNDRAWAWRVGLPSVAFALAVAAKVSAVVLGPAIMATIIAYRFTIGRRSLRPDVVDALVITAAGIALAVIYCGPGGGPSFQGTLAAMRLDHPLRPLVAFVAGLPLFPNGLYAIWFQFDHALAGQAAFINGRSDAESLWFYLPLLLSIKLPIVLLLGSVLALLWPPIVPQRLMLAGAVLGGSMLVLRIQTGVRLALPLIALLVVWIAARVAQVTSPAPALRRGAWAAIIVLTAMTTARAWPDPLRFVNEAWGHVDEAYRYVSDSNYDWGQGLPELAEWQARTQAETAVWYFGTDPRFPHLQRVNPRAAGFSPDQLRERSIAISTSLLYGGYVTDGDAFALVAKARTLAPLARTRTFLIFEGNALTR